MGTVTPIEQANIDNWPTARLCTLRAKKRPDGQIGVYVDIADWLELQDKSTMVDMLRTAASGLNDVCDEIAADEEKDEPTQ